MPNGKLSEDFIPASTYSKSTEEQENNKTAQWMKYDVIWNKD